MKNVVIAFWAALLFILSPLHQAQAVTPAAPHDFTCATCHTPHTALGSTGYDNICLTCHRGGDPLAGAKSFAPGDAADPFGRYTSGVQNSMQISHRWDGADINTRAGAAASVQPQMTSVRSRTSGALACVRCHNPHSQENKPFLRMNNDSDQMCLDCHRSRNTTDHTTGTHPVGVDYQATAAGRPAEFNAAPVNANPANSSSALKLVGGKVSCSTCHGVHAVDSNSATFDSFTSLAGQKPSDGSLLRTDRRAVSADAANICTNCHAGKFAHNGRNQNIQCADCHGAHVDTGDGSTPNVWLIKRDMGAGNGAVVFTDVANKNYKGTNGVCESCHAVPTSSGFQFHLTETNGTCNNCHVHGNSKGAFSVDASKACNSCHGYPPQANTVGFGGYAAGYEASPSYTDESTSGHSSHASTPYQKACYSCHNGNTHQSGTFQDVFKNVSGVAKLGGLTPGYNPSTQVCSNVYCHSNARGITTNTPSWKNGKGTIIGTTGECGTCHSAAGAASPNWSVSHTRHINGYAANANFTCNVCHAKTAASSSAIFGTMTARSLHTNGTKDIAFNTFVKGGTWNAQTQSCSATYCHSNVQGDAGTGTSTSFTPALTWGGSAPGCGSCHASMVKFAALSTATGSHKLHAQTYSFECSVCHGTGYSVSGSITPVATHVDGVITMGLTGTAAVNGAVPSYYQGNNAPGNGYSTCATVYCHSNVQGAAGAGMPTAFAAPTWGGTALVCGSCHANMATSTAASGSHVKHVQSAGYGCPTCHNGAGKDINPPFAPTAQHANGTIEVSFSGNAAGTGYTKGSAIAPGLGYGSCTTSCHSATTAIVTTPTWGGSATCVTCHGTLQPVTGSHTKHMALGSAACGSCHAGAEAGSSGGVNHLDGDIDVSNGYPANVAKHVSGTYTGTCSASSCHADPYSSGYLTTPVWGTVVSGGCSSCHNGVGAFSGTGSAPATGSHNKHMGAVSVSCGQCHLGSVAGVAGGNGHGNGSIDVANGYPANVIKHAAGTYSGTCSTTCHSTTTDAVATPTWGISSDCGSCHGAVPATGSHGLHFGVFSVCSDCHTGAVQDVSGGFGHFNSKIDVVNGYPASVTKHAAGVFSGTCSTAPCHFNPYGTVPAVTPVWGVETVTHCAGCHNGAGAFTGAGASPVTGSHGVHMNAGSGCGQCHSGASTVNGGSAHKDGNISVSNGYPANVSRHAAGTYSGTCSASTCHGSFGTPVWGVSTGNDFCTKCHGTGTVSVSAGNRYVVAPSDPAGVGTGKVSANLKTGAHQTHIQRFNGFSNYSTFDYRCEACHGTLPTANTYSHADGNSSPSGKFQNLATNWGKRSITYVTGGGCTNTYCHNPAGTGGTLTAGNEGSNPVPAWTDPTYLADGTHKTLTNCNKCHKVPGEAGFSGYDHGSTTIADSCIGCHGHEGDTQGGKGQRHMDGIKWGIASCDGCHGYPPMSAADFAVKTGFVNAKIEDYAGGGGHHSQHLLDTVTAADRFTPCLPCHPDAAAGFHNQGNGVVVKTNVTVNIAADTGYRFDSNRSKRYDAVSMSCSNVSCHFQPTASW